MPTVKLEMNVVRHMNEQIFACACVHACMFVCLCFFFFRFGRVRGKVVISISC